MFPTGNYMFKVNNRNTKTRCEICSKLLCNFIEITLLHKCWHSSIVNFENISHLVLAFLLLTMNR